MINYFCHKRKLVSFVMIFAIIIFIFNDFLYTTPLFAQDSAAELLKKGVDYYKEAEFELAIEMLNLAVYRGLAEKEDVILAHKTLAAAYLAIGNEQKAREEYVKLLTRYPIFDLLLSESPTIQKVFSDAKKDYEKGDNAPPHIEFDPPLYVQENNPIQMTAKITDISGVQSVLFYYRTPGQKHFKTLVMERKTGDDYANTIPKEEITNDGIEFYLVAIDNAGNDPASVGSQKEPLFIKIHPEDKYPPVISHKPVMEGMEGEKITLTATVLDNVGVSRVRIFFRQKGKQFYQTQRFEKKDENLYEFVLTGRPEGIEYYIEARDVSGNSPATWRNASTPHFLKINAKPVEALVAKRKGLPWYYYAAGTVVLGASVALVAMSGGNNGTKTEPDLPLPPNTP